MGLSDLFANHHHNSNNKARTGALVDAEKDDVFARLTEELVRVREERKQAAERAREAEDTLRLKESILDSLERRIENLESENHRLLSVETELALVREDQRMHPLSSSDALHRFDHLAEVFGQLRDTLSCAVCYEPYGRDEAVSLLCGHSFCRACFAHWEQRHAEAWKLNPHQRGVYPGAECPECRSTEVRRGKVRVWALEEAVRLVERAVRDVDAYRFTPSAPPAAPRPAVVDEPEPGSNDRTLVRATPSPDTVAGTDPVTARPASPALGSNSTSFLEPEPTPTLVVQDSHGNHSEDSPATVEAFADERPHRESVATSSAAGPDSPLPPRDRDGRREQESDTEMHDVEEGSPSAAEVEEARNLLRPRTPNPYVAVFFR
ncbi:hypothetical protein JCM11491_006666 [Sporobolomyces phaffii]